LASEYAGHHLSPSSFPAISIDELRSQSIVELSIGAFREGCIAETLSVLSAARDFDQLQLIEQKVILSI
jgi:hypothetical protein